MPSRPANQLDFIRNNYKELHVAPNSSISYVNLLKGDNERYAFVCIKKQRTTPNRVIQRSPQNNEDKNDESNLTGSPLKDDCCIEVVNLSLSRDDVNYFKTWTDLEESYVGIDVDTARSITVDICDDEETLQSSTEPLWILCNKSDAEKTILIENRLDDKWWTRGSVFQKPQIPIDSIHMDDLIKKHLQRYPEFKEFETEIDSTYRLKDNIHVKVETRFSKNMYPSFTYFQDCRIILKQFLSRKEDDFEANSFWCDVLTLNYIKKYILDFPTSNKNEPDYDCGTGMKLRDLKNEIANLFTTISYCTDLNDQEEGVTEGSILKATVKAAKNRDYTDITDSLWNLLKCSGSYQDLKTAFNYLFHFVQTNNIVNIPANKNNNLARLIVEISSGRLMNLCLVETEPLELLLEIGLEKVEKDYEYIFTKSKITTTADLQSGSEFYKENVSMKSDGMVRKSVFHVTNPNKINQMGRATTLLTRRGEAMSNTDEDHFHHSDFDENETEIKLCKLAHFHGVLEHLLLVNSVFNDVGIYTSIMEHMLQQPMHYPFRVVKDRGFKDLDMEIVNNTLLRVVKGKCPNSRRVQLKSAKKFIEMQTTYFHSIDPIFPIDPLDIDDYSKGAVVNGSTHDATEQNVDRGLQQLYNDYLYMSVKTRK